MKVLLRRLGQVDRPPGDSARAIGKKQGFHGTRLRHTDVLTLDQYVERDKDENDAEEDQISKQILLRHGSCTCVALDW